MCKSDERKRGTCANEDVINSRGVGKFTFFISHFGAEIAGGKRFPRAVSMETAKKRVQQSPIFIRSLYGASRRVLLFLS